MVKSTSLNDKYTYQSTLEVPRKAEDTPVKPSPFRGLPNQSFSQVSDQTLSYPIKFVSA